MSMKEEKHTIIPELTELCTLHGIDMIRSLHFIPVPKWQPKMHVILFAMTLEEARFLMYGNGTCGNHSLEGCDAGQRGLTVGSVGHPKGIEAFTGIFILSRGHAEWDSETCFYKHTLKTATLIAHVCWYCFRLLGWGPTLISVRA